MAPSLHSLATVALLTALAACSGGSGSRTTMIALPEPDTRLSTIVIDRSEDVLADGEDAVQVEVRIVDADGLPLYARPVALEFDGVDAEIDTADAMTDTDGYWRAVLRTTRAGLRTVRAVVDPGYELPKFELEVPVTVRFIGDAQSISGAESEVRVVPRGPLLATGAVAAPVEAVVRDVRGNPVPGIQVQFVATGADNHFAPAQGVSDADGIARSELTTTVPEQKIVAARIFAPKGIVDAATIATAEFLGDGLAAGDRRILYGRLGVIESVDRTASAGLSTPRDLGTVEDEPEWIVDARATTRPFEHLAITLSRTESGTALRARRWNGIGWSLDWSAPYVELVNVERRGFDLAYESLSGKALAVFTDGFRTPRYRVYDGTVWTDELSLPLDGSGPLGGLSVGAVQWIRLVARAGTDEVVAVFSDSLGNLIAIRWDGAQWVASSAVRIEQSLVGGVASRHRPFDATFTMSGALVVAWGSQDHGGVRTVRRLANADAWGAPTSVGTLTPQFVALSADTLTDQVALVGSALDGTVTHQCARHDGSTWTDVVSHAGLGPSITGDSPAAVAWHAGVAICVFTDASSSGIAWSRNTGASWQVQTPLPYAGGGELASIELEANAFGVDLLTTSRSGALLQAGFAAGSWDTPLQIATGVEPTAVASTRK